MPTYNFKRNDTGEEYSLFLPMSERETYIKENNVTQLLTSIAVVSGRGMGKPDAGFRDLLKTIKKGNSKGIYASPINTF